MIHTRREGLCTAEAGLAFVRSGMTPAPTFTDWLLHAAEVVRAMLAAGDPCGALRRAWVRPTGVVRLLATGKAAIGMASEALTLLGAAPAELIVTAPEAVPVPESLRAAGAKVFTCDHPYPTPRNAEAARAVAEMVGRVGEDETLVALLSGGASAHLSFPCEPLSIDDLAAATRALQRAGATIRELNTVRKHVEQLKGGRLAARCRGRVEAYILSDVIGDPLEVIASGPTAADPTTFADALRVLEGRSLTATLPNVADLLRHGANGGLAETPKPGDAVFARVMNRIIASNRQGVDAVAARLAELGFAVQSVEHGVEGEAATIGRRMVATASACTATGPRAWVIGGEWTVTVGDGDGVGGPSQELALAGAEALARIDCPMSMLAFSSDGRDGPTSAAGAIVTHETWHRIAATRLEPASELCHHDSHAALDVVNALIRTGPTETNINHVAVLAAW